MSKVSSIIAGLIVLLIFIWFFTADEEEKQAIQASQIEQNKLSMKREVADTLFPVRFEEFAERDYQESLVHRGRTRAKWKSDIKTEAEGKIEKLYFSEWELVEKGALLAKIDGGDLETQIRLAEIDIKVKRKEYEAEKKLAEKGVSGELKALRAELALVQSESNLEGLMIRKEKLEVSSPLNGTIIERHAVEGEFVGKGKAIARLVSLDPMLVDVFVVDNIRRRLSKGMRVEVSFGEGLSFEGLVSNVATEVDKATKTYAIEVSIANRDSKLVEGMPASVTFEMDKMRAHFIESSHIVLDAQGDLGVMVVDEQDEVSRAKFVEVRLLSDAQDGVWVSGLEGRVKIITDGNYYVRDGDRVSGE